MSFRPENNVTLYEPIQVKLDTYKNNFAQISGERKEALNELAGFIERKIREGKKAELIFICTHNSRRSHISQLWAQAIASYYDTPNVIAYSGGTEATAFNPRAVKAMQDVGFRIIRRDDNMNPVYEVRFSDDVEPIRAFSKKYDHLENPDKDFAALMTCSHADANCPIVYGAEERISIPYDDPKDYDGTEEESIKYAERVQQIGTELLFAFSLVKK